MSKQVWKYLVTISDNNQQLTIPSGAKLVYVGPQGKRIGLWFEVNTNETRREPRIFRVFGTGHPINGGDHTVSSHIGTVIMVPFVWHVYEITGI